MERGISGGFTTDFSKSAMGGELRIAVLVQKHNLSCLSSTFAISFVTTEESEEVCFVYEIHNIYSIVLSG